MKKYIRELYLSINSGGLNIEKYASFEYLKTSTARAYRLEELLEKPKGKR